MQINGPSRETIIAALRLARAKGVGPITFRRLVAHCGGVVQAVDQVEDLCRQHNRKLIIPTPLKQAEKEYETATQAGAQFLVLGEAGYPELLAHIPDPPPVLTVLGNAELLHKPAIAIVGNRNASVAGGQFTAALVKDFCAAKYVIISGLARGIDTAAHKATLQQPDATNPGTIAVVAGGADHIYPPENKALRQELLEAGKGCIVSENAWGTTPTARHFPNRNRIIAGLSHAVCVTEASRHSGSLITARQAGQQGRDVFAVPGSPADPRAQGPNHLLKQGASLLESAEDVLEALRHSGFSQKIFRPTETKNYVREQEIQAELFGQVGTPKEEASAEQFSTAQGHDTQNNAAHEPLEDALPQTNEERLLSALSTTPIAVDDLLRQVNLPELEIMLLLSDLELSGRISRTVLGEVRLA